MAEQFCIAMKAHAQASSRLFYPGSINDETDFRSVFVDGDIDVNDAMTAAIRALLDVPVSGEMLSQAYEANDYQNDDADNLAIWTTMLTQLVREIEGSGG
jgi:hypothetical protein